MGLGTLIRNFFETPFDYQINAYDNSNKSEAVKIGDHIECAIAFSEGIQYKVEELHVATKEARIRRIEKDGTLAESYTVGIKMIRPLANKLD